MKRELIKGIVEGIEIDTYHALPFISKSQLDDLNQSPFHFYSRNRDPIRPPRPEKAGQLEGNLAHCAILEPDAFNERYVMEPKDAPRRPTEAQWNAKNPSPNSIAAMEWWKEFKEEIGGKRLITVSQYDVAWRQAESVRTLPDVRRMLERGIAEASAFWTDGMTGVECRCRPDFVHPFSKSSVALLDVKTFSSADPEEFRKQVARKRYHVQDAFYSAGVSAATSANVDRFIFIAVETEWPFAAASYTLSEASREEGYLEWHRLLDIYEQCARTNTWPSYAPKTTEIELPPYAFTPQEVEISYV